MTTERDLRQLERQRQAYVKLGGYLMVEATNLHVELTKAQREVETWQQASEAFEATCTLQKRTIAGLEAERDQLAKELQEQGGRDG